MGESDQGETGPEQGGVFGNLPRSRPGTRSPRRQRASGRPPGGGAEPPAEPAAETPPEPAAPPQPEPASAHAEAPPSEPDLEAELDLEAEPDREGNGLEDLAWAGVAAAAEAATIGVRLASRAMEALRDSVERR
jgi:hypothetical protein